jgi:hypothetical protein
MPYLERAPGLRRVQPTQVERPTRVARQYAGSGEVVACDQGVGVVGAEQPLVIGEVALVQGDRIAQPTSVPVGQGEVVA